MPPLPSIQPLKETAFQNLLQRPDSEPLIRSHTALEHGLTDNVRTIAINGRKSQGIVMQPGEEIDR